MVLGGLAFLAACEKKAAPSFERPPAPVTVTTAVTQDVPNYIDAIGKFVAREVVSIQPQVSGRITQIHFDDGADVKVGQVLFTIDPRPYQAQLNLAEANLGQAKAALELAKINFDRVASVTDQRAVSRQDHDAKKERGRRWPRLNSNKTRPRWTAPVLTSTTARFAHLSMAGPGNGSSTSVTW